MDTFVSIIKQMYCNLKKHLIVLKLVVQFE